MKKKWKLGLFGLIPLGILAGDLISKYFIVMEPRPYKKEIIGNFFRFTFVYNEGITFGLFNSASNNVMPYILSILSLIALGVVVYLFLKIDSFVKEGPAQNWGRVALMFVLGGALGNIIDRLFFFNDPTIPGHKAVVDFLDVGIKDVRWYTFNVADSFVVVGSIILGVLFLFFEKKKGDNKQEPEIEPMDGSHY